MKYSVSFYQDYQNNNGNPVYSEKFEFDTLKEADAKMSELMELEPELGLTNYARVVDEDGIFYREDSNSGRYLKPTEIIITYHHDTYINYCYVIEDVKFADEGMKTSDLQYDRDITYQSVDLLFDSVEELEHAFIRRQSIFNKIKTGSHLINEFIEENV